MSTAAPEATNRASTTPRSDGVGRLGGRGGEVAMATGRITRRSMPTRRRLPDGGRPGKRASTAHARCGAAAPPERAGSTGAAAQLRLVDLGDRIVRTATVDLEVGKDRLNDTINRATDVVTRAKGIYVGSSTSVPAGGPAARSPSGSRWTPSNRCCAS